MSLISDIFAGGAKGVFEGVGSLVLDIKKAITGKEPISAEKAAEIALKVQELQSLVEQGRQSIIITEASSHDKWTSRARPAFMYVMYVFILAAFPMGVIFAFAPVEAKSITDGVTSWLKAIPDSMWVLFGTGYLGYSYLRSQDKKNGVAS
jgi:hypothetical protein